MFNYTTLSDNGGKFLALCPFLSQHGISHCTIPPHTPKHNGFSKCRHRHIIESLLRLSMSCIMLSITVKKKLSLIPSMDLLDRQN